MILSQVHLFPPLLQVPGLFYLCNRQCVGDFETEGDMLNLALIQNKAKRKKLWIEGRRLFHQEGNGSVVSLRHLDVCIMM